MLANKKECLIIIFLESICMHFNADFAAYIDLLASSVLILD